MEPIKYFKDLSAEAKEEAYYRFDSGERLYGLSEEDDTHIKFVVMTAISQAKLFQSPDFVFEVVFGVGKDDKGLYVSNALKEALLANTMSHAL